jgi:outer membrane protein TolC
MKRAGRPRWFGLTLVLAAAQVRLCVAAEDARAQTTLRLTPELAVELALEHDLELKTARFGPEIAEADVSAALTAWTPEVSGTVLGSRSEAPPTTATEQAGTLTNRQLSSEVALSQRLPWGSSYRVGVDAARRRNSSVVTRFRPERSAGAVATLEQPLLRGLTFDPARAERAISLEARELADTDLAAAQAATTRAVLYDYWAWIYARDFLAVQRDSLAMAQELFAGNRKRVATGAMAAVDVIEAEAEVARRAEVILTAEKNVANAEEQLRLRIFGPITASRDVALEPQPGADVRPATAEATTRALAARQELQSFRTALAIDEIQIRRFRNDALPEVTVLASYELAGLGGTELIRGAGFPGPVTDTDRRSFSSVLDDLAETRYPGWSVELAFSYPLGESRPEADAARVSLERRQREAALRAAEQRVIVEVNAAVREFETNYRRLDTSATAVALAERRLDGEQRKFALRLSTSFLVVQAQRDLSAAREAQLRSLLDYHLATVDVGAVQVIPLDRRSVPTVGQ